MESLKGNWKDGDCDGCVYSVPLITDDDDVIAKCRRYPPVLFVIDNDVNQGSPDAVKRCGEYTTVWDLGDGPHG